MNSTRMAIPLICVLSQIFLPEARTFSFRVSASQQKAAPRVAPQFTVESQGDVLDEGGRRLALTGYRATDGVLVTNVHGIFDSPSEADSYFEKETAKAMKVVRRGLKKNRKGDSVGRRAEVLYPPSPPNTKAVPAVLWTDGTSYYVLISPSLPDILSLEKKWSRQPDY
jgi:hypothetical protein